MLTLNELQEMLSLHYTAEELVDMLEITPQDIVSAFTENVYDNQEKLLKTVKEDIGYASD